MHLVLRLREGGHTPVEREPGIVPGGLIKQCIMEDKSPASVWEREHAICFNVQFLNSGAFRQVTGIDPPETPISAATYASQGLPLLKIYNETSTVKGDFDDVASVKALDKAKARKA